jgi:hypothetical protein
VSSCGFVSGMRLTSSSPKPEPSPPLALNPNPETLNPQPLTLTPKQVNAFSSFYLFRTLRRDRMSALDDEVHTRAEKPRPTFSTQSSKP